MHFVYVIYSSSKDSYYIGETVNVEERIIQHQQHLYAGSYTKIASDWELAFLLTCKDRASALKAEKHLKKGKSKVYLKRLHQDKDALEKLKYILRQTYSIEID